MPLSDPITITTSTESDPWAAFAHGGQQRIFHCSTGMWIALVETADTLNLWYSADGLAWTQDTGVSLTFSGITSPAFTGHLDENDFLHVAWASSSTDVSLKRFVPNAGRTVWSSTVTATRSVAADYVCVLGMTVGGSNRSVVAWEDTGADETRFNHVTWSDATSAATATWQKVSDAVIGGENLNALVMDLVHTGDGVTPAAAPHIWVGFATSSSIGGCKLTYSGGDWTAGTERTLTTAYVLPAGTGYWMQVFYDGTRFVTVASARDAALENYFVVLDRNLADTTTTVTFTKNMTTYGSGTEMAYGGAGYDAQGSVYFCGIDNGVGEGSHEIFMRKWKRGETDFTAHVLDSSGYSGGHVSVLRKPTTTLAFGWRDGSGSPYNVQLRLFPLNQAFSFAGVGAVLASATTVAGGEG